MRVKLPDMRVILLPDMRVILLPDMRVKLPDMRVILLPDMRVKLPDMRVILLLGCLTWGPLARISRCFSCSLFSRPMLASSCQSPCRAQQHGSSSCFSCCSLLTACTGAACSKSAGHARMLSSCS